MFIMVTNLYFRNGSLVIPSTLRTYSNLARERATIALLSSVNERRNGLLIVKLAWRNPLQVYCSAELTDGRTDGRTEWKANFLPRNKPQMLPRTLLHYGVFDRVVIF